MKLSKNFTLEELTKSATAQRLGIDNTPNADITSNLKALVDNILQPLRDVYGKPIRVSSGYRSEKLNKKIGGSSTSEHRYGMAADITSLSDTLTDNAELFNTLINMLKANNIPFGQLIYEYGNEVGPDWIHISYNPKRQRKQILRCRKVNGKATYEPMK